MGKTTIKGGGGMDTLFWYWEIGRDYAAQMLPCAGLGALFFLALGPARRARLVRRGLRSGPWREGALVLFVMFCAGLLALTVFPANFWTAGHWREVLQGGQPLFPPVDRLIQHRTVNLVPFRGIAGAFQGGGWVWFLLLANVGIFLPVGFFPALLWRGPGWRWPLAGCCASCLIECAQFFTDSSADVDDVILNTLGALAGYGLFRLLRGLAPGFTQRFQVQVEVPDGRETGTGGPAPGAGAGQL